MTTPNNIAGEEWEKGLDEALRGFWVQVQVYEGNSPVGENDYLAYGGVLRIPPKVKHSIKAFIHKTRQEAYEQRRVDGGQDSWKLGYDSGIQEAIAGERLRIREEIEKEKVAGSLPSLNEDEIFRNDIIDDILSLLTPNHDTSTKK